MNITPDISLNMVKQAARKHGVTLPKPLTQGLDALDHAKGEQARWHTTGTDMAEAVIDAWVQGRDPLDDTDVRQAATRLTLASPSAMHAVINGIEKRRTALIREHAAATLTAFKPVIRKADKTLAESREQLPTLNLDPSQANQLATDVVPAWGRAREAAETIEQVQKAWQMLAESCRIATLAGHRSALLIVADLNAEQLDTLKSDNVRSAAEAGHTFTLASPDVFAERLERVQQQRNEQEQRRAAAREHARNRSLSAGA